MIELRALGPVEVRANGHAAPPELLWRKHLAILVYLSRSPRRTRTREHLMNLLWGDKPESAARHSLREAIRVLRHAAGEGALDTDADQVRLAESAVRSDVDQLEALAAAADWRGAAGLAVGDFLEGFGVADAPAFEDWLAAERLAIRRRSVEVLTRHAEELQRRGAVAASGALARRALALDPASDAAVCALMTALALGGERAAALEAYQRFAAHLRESLGAEPSATAQRLAEQVRRERVWRRPAARPGGAESRRAPLVGRDAELNLVLDAWRGGRPGRATLVMIEGAAGSGRTRLTEEIAARARLDGAATVTVRATPADRGEPWAGVMALAAGGLLDADGIGGAPPEALAAFAGRLDAWGDRFPAARRMSPRSPATALGDIVRAAASEQPIALVVDDAHWLDAETLTCLHSVLRDLAALRILVVTTVEPQPPRDELALLRSRLGRDIPGTLITLEPLDPEALRSLSHWAMPGYDAIETDRLARRVAADSAGLPLLAVELLHAVALGLDLHGTPGAWPEPARTLDQTLPGDLPDSVVAAIRVGFRRLSHHAQSALIAIAVLGEPLVARRIGAATGIPGDALAAALDEAEWQRWIAAGGRGYAFVARLARDVVARDMVTAGQRQRLLERT